ncbi:50S ribosomal protein L15 [Candidatus Methylomirabilis lanthanidiphila]|uniref:Large ribosomal subunit protein uL15 n=1 Tax=Candidatus Methylomirabilis lanthanidiphila TaxID=2211376 RepID=A0A564ZGG8_9BACT|nr:50S ribosomal protein L15 [Candidatus Methylomirabilis lanthanidiphila]VUZ84420.1 50S ribosomal protein L15 [Candidatus Methylomirabilis lanthanidiphila]
MRLHELKPPVGATRRRKRVGRGTGSGHGKTSGKGEKGQKARSGAHIHPWFEGGQLPLHRRVPKRGFTNRFKKVYATVNLKDLERFDAGTHVTPDLLQERRLVKDLNAGLKVLADGVLSKPLSVTAHKFSKRSIEKIVACGGTVEVIGA